MSPVHVFAVEKKATRIHLNDATFEWHTNENLTAKLVNEDNVPLGGKEVWLYQKISEEWQELGFDVTDENGVARFPIYVTMQDGTYFFKVTFKGDAEFCSSSDTAMIIVTGNLVLTISTILLILTAIDMIIFGVETVDEIYDEHFSSLAEVFEKLKEEEEEWEAKVLQAKAAGGTYILEDSELADRDKAIERMYVHTNEEDVGMFLVLTRVPGSGIFYTAVTETGLIFKESDETYKTDATLAAKLREKGKKLYEEGIQEDDEDKKFSGATLCYSGTKLLYAIVDDIEDLDKLKKLGIITSIYNPYEPSEFSIIVVPEKTYYVSGESTKTEIRVINNKDKDVSFWLGVSFKDKNGAIYDVPGDGITPDPNNVEIAPDTMKEFTVEWAIPNDVPVGEYQIAVNCWKDDTFTDKYTDEFEWKKLFYVPDFHITASPEKVWYQPGEKVVIAIDVGNLGEDKNIWFDATLVDSQGGLQYPDVTPNPDDVLIQGGESKTFTAEWIIPQDAPLGGYALFINCYKEAPPPGTCPLPYADDFDSKVAFFCYKFNIVSPTDSNPASVGDPTDPIKFYAKVSTGVPIPLYMPGVFSAKINDEQANVMVVYSPIDKVNGEYLLRITPPLQAIVGRYDLEITMDLGFAADYDVEGDAVMYSEGGNVDVVEVIDRSGSMGGEKIQSARDSAKLFADLMSINDSIGVASYSSSASVNYPLTTIISDAVKQGAKDAIDAISAGGSTSIGAGLRAGYNELTSKGDPTRPWSIILMSDGFQNASPHPDSVLPDIRNADIRVFTIGLGAGADASLLSHIAHDSGGGGGEYYYSPSSEELRAVYNAIAGVVRAESTVKTVSGSVSEGETIAHKVCIDSTINVATFTVTWASGTLDLGLERPDNSKVSPGDSDVISHTKEATYETYSIDNPMVGDWTMEITVPTSGSLSKMSVVATQAGISYTASVTAKADLTAEMYTDKDQYNLNEPLKLIIALSKTGEPIVGADVNATVHKPDGTEENLSLYDDGGHDDGMAMDGVYANYYTNTDKNGSYSINIRVSGTMSPEEFTRETTKSVYVSSSPGGKISVTPGSWSAETGSGGEIVVPITVDSASGTDEIVNVSSTDLTDAAGNVIYSRNLFSIPSTFSIPAGENADFYEFIYAPWDAEVGIYNGSIVLTSTANSLSIPVNLKVLIATRGATDLSTSSAVLNSEFILGDHPSVEMYFLYRKAGVSEWINTTPTTYTASGSHSENVSGLDSNTTYEFMAVLHYEIDNVEYEVTGSVLTFNAITPATININPDTLNLKSKGRWITCIIELPEGYSVEDIDVSTIRLLVDNDNVAADPRPTGIGGRKLMVKFSRSAVQAIVDIGEVELTVTGLVNNVSFEGSDTIRVIKPGKEPPAGPPATISASSVGGIGFADGIPTDSGIENIYIMQHKANSYDNTENLSGHENLQVWEGNTAVIEDIGLPAENIPYENYFDIVVAVKGHTDNMAYVNKENMYVRLVISNAFSDDENTLGTGKRYVFEDGTPTYIRVNHLFDNDGNGYKLGSGENIDLTVYYYAYK